MLIDSNKMPELDNLRSQREALRREYAAAFEKLLAILFEADPMGINFGDNTDEYEPEVGTILPRLANCRSVEEIQAVVHDEFVRWFDASIAGPPTRYGKIAERIWSELAEWRAT